MTRIYFSSRHAGNFGDHVGDDPQSVATRRGDLARALSVDQVAFMNQVHGNLIVEVQEASEAIPTCDALITTVKGLALAVMVADCIPLLLTSDVAVAAVHVGRPGLVAGIAPLVVRRLKELGASQISAFIGPSICRDCYEVSPEMYQEISGEFPATATSPELHALDLIAGLRHQLGQEVREITDLHLCTKQSPDHFSYRREHQTGRQVGVVIL